VSLTLLNNLSAVSLTPVNSFSAVSLTPAKNFMLFGYFSVTRISPVCREGFFILPYNELAIAQGPKIYQKKAL
jgi:hypothetical protein